MSNFNKIQTTNPELNRVQQNLDDFFKRQVVEELNGGVFVTDQVITTSDTYVSHGLGRKPRGYLVVDRNANAVVYKSSTTNNRPNLELILLSSATVTVDLYVF